MEKIFKFIYNNILRKRRIRFTAQNVNQLDGKTILDVGCQDCLLKKYINKRFLYHGIDLQNPDNKNIIIGDIEELETNEKYDIIICTEVLEHLKNPVSTIKKMKNIANKYIVISIPHDPQYMLSRMLIPCGEHYWTITPEILKIHLGKPFKECFYNFRRHYFSIWKIRG